MPHRLERLEMVSNRTIDGAAVAGGLSFQYWAHLVGEVGQALMFWGGLVLLVLRIAVAIEEYRLKRKQRRAQAEAPGE